MTDMMEDMVVAFSINEWPGRNPFSKCTWEKNAWPSQKGLQSQFLDLLERVRVITEWSDTMISPLSLWLPGLFNPTAYLTAIKQVTARATRQFRRQPLTERARARPALEFVGDAIGLDAWGEFESVFARRKAATSAAWSRDQAQKARGRRAGARH